MQLTQAEARKMCCDPQSGFFWVTAEENVSLLPRYQTDVGHGIREYLDAKIGFVCDKFEGAVMGYTNIRLLGDKGQIIDDAPYIGVRVRADFVVFQPRVGATLQGEVNKMGKDHVGVVVHGHFNVSIHLSPSAQTHPHTALTKGDHCSFVVTRVHMHRGLLSMVGEMV